MFSAAQPWSWCWYAFLVQGLGEIATISFVQLTCMQVVVIIALMWMYDYCVACISCAAVDHDDLSGPCRRGAVSETTTRRCGSYVSRKGIVYL